MGKPASQVWPKYHTTRPPYWPMCLNRTAYALGVARATEVACARLGTLYRRSEQSGERRGSGKGELADGEAGNVARGWRRLPAWAWWELHALAVVIALGATC